MTTVFYLGTHEPGWLARSDAALFISRRRLARRGGSAPVAATDWVLDSGGYTELNKYGTWSITPAQYVQEVQGWQAAVGRMRWCAPMDWMCEPHVLLQTGLTVGEHQVRTIDNYVQLRAALGPVVVPVLQGWLRTDYMRHCELYAARGIDLAAEPLVGVGSVCRRGQDDAIVSILRMLHGNGLRLHAFGVRTSALVRAAHYLASADSMAWSANARMEGRPMLAGCTHKTCQNCYRWAHTWYGLQVAALAAAHPYGEEELWASGF